MNRDCHWLKSVHGSVKLYSLFWRPLLVHALYCLPYLPTKRGLIFGQVDKNPCPPPPSLNMHACMHNMFTKSFNKNLMCCARQFSFIAIVVFTEVKKSATKSAKMSVVITWYGLLNCHLRVPNEWTNYTTVSAIVNYHLSEFVLIGLLYVAAH